MLSNMSSNNKAMRNVAILNNGDGGSTGNIAKNLQRSLKERGYNCFFCYGRGKETDDDNYRIDSNFEIRYHAFMTRLTGLQGFYSKHATKRLLSKFESWGIDSIYIVCIHGYYLNERMIYAYAASHKISLIHIMIDEYAFTGKCPYHDDCMRYMIGCGRCPHKKAYPSSHLLDGSAKVYKMKSYAYSVLKTSVFVGPKFVIDQAKKSPLFKHLQTEVLDEAIDVEIFSPRSTDTLMKSLGLTDDKKIILCVVPYNGEETDRKGGKYFIELARKFEDDNNFVFVHVGYVNKNQENLPGNYIHVGFIKDMNLLAEYFSIGDLFVFPSLLDSMPNACLDALACGTPLLCFNISGMPYVANDDVGTFVEPKNVDALAEVVRRTKKKTKDIIDTCRNYALARYDCREYNRRLIKIAENIK